MSNQCFILSILLLGMATRCPADSLGRETVSPESDAAIDALWFGCPHVSLPVSFATNDYSACRGVWILQNLGLSYGDENAISSSWSFPTSLVSKAGIQYRRSDNEDQECFDVLSDGESVLPIAKCSVHHYKNAREARIYAFDLLIAPSSAPFLAIVAGLSVEVVDERSDCMYIASGGHGVIVYKDIAVEVLVTGDVLARLIGKNNRYDERKYDKLKNAIADLSVSIISCGLNGGEKKLWRESLHRTTLKCEKFTEKFLQMRMRQRNKRGQ